MHNKDQKEKILIWLRGQRQSYRNGSQSEERIEKLQEQTKGWLDKVHDIDKEWITVYVTLRQFILDNGRYPCLRSKDKEEHKLSKWIVTQRQAKKSKGKRKITEDRIDFLNQLPNWFWITDDKWIRIYNELKKFIELNNKYPCRNLKDKEEKSLFFWVHTQKDKKKSNTLTDEKNLLLEQLSGWMWDVDKQWLETYDKLKRFIEKNNRYPSRSSEILEEKKLGSWIGTQKQAKKGNSERRIAEERISLLEHLPNWEWKTYSLFKNLSIF